MIKNVDDFYDYSKQIKLKLLPTSGITILISLGTCGIAAGANTVNDAFKKEISRLGLDTSIKIIETGCMGLCYCEPSIEVIDRKNGTSRIYGNVRVGAAAKIIDNLKYQRCCF